MVEERMNVSLDHSDVGFFTESVTIAHKPGKFIFDFTQVVPKFDQIGGEVKQSLSIKHRTVIMDPELAKSMLSILGENLKTYEKNFKKIKTTKIKTKTKPSEYTEDTMKYIG